MFFIWLEPSLHAEHFLCYEFLLKSQESRVRRDWTLARVFQITCAGGWRRSEVGWAWICVAFHTPFFGLHPPEPICLFFNIFDFFFLGWLCLFFLMPLKFLKYFFHHFCIYGIFVCLFLLFIYKYIYIYYLE